MNKKKRDEEYLDDITESIVRVLGKRPSNISMDMFLKNDLGLSSLDVVDVEFELEQITGLNVQLREIFLCQEVDGPHKPRDICIRDITQHLARLSDSK